MTILLLFISAPVHTHARYKLNLSQHYFLLTSGNYFLPGTLQWSVVTCWTMKDIKTKGNPNKHMLAPHQWARPISSCSVPCFNTILMKTKWVVNFFQVKNLKKVGTESWKQVTFGDTLTDNCITEPWPQPHSMSLLINPVPAQSHTWSPMSSLLDQIHVLEAKQERSLHCLVHKCDGNACNQRSTGAEWRPLFLDAMFHSHIWL